MPLYISNTNRIESLENKLRGVNSTTTTTLTPPLYGWAWARNAPGDETPPHNFDITYIFEGDPGNRSWETYDTNSYFYNRSSGSGGVGFGIDYNNAPNIFPDGWIWKSPVGSDFQVKPDIFGKIATFVNTYTTASGNYMLASYIPWSSSYMRFEFVPPSSSIQRCVTYPAYTYFTSAITGSGDTSWKLPVDSSIFGADCTYDIECQCDLCYNKSNQSGRDSISSGGEPCSSVTTTTTSTTTTSTTTTSTTSTTTTSTTTTTAAPYDVEFLLVAGGGGGGNDGGGGAGGGEFVSGSHLVTPTLSYSVVIGLGGSGSVSPQVSGSQGESSTVFGYTAVGGGGGGSIGNIGGVGANGGGGSYGASGSIGTAGFDGGNGFDQSTGGGAGAGENGENAPGFKLSGDGGDGKLWLDSNYYGGGGGGGEVNSSATSSLGIGGLGGGGSAVLSNSGQNGTPNTGGGGAGSANDSPALVGGNGGSGIVIIRYSGSPRGTGGTITESGSYTYHTFESSSAFVA